MKYEEPDTLSLDISTQELEAVKRILHSLISLFKTYNLYNSEHSIARNSLAKLLDELDSFLRIHEKLRLDTRKNNFYYKGTEIYAGQAEENNPAYLLARDGLEYVEFIRGITSAEISAFIHLLIQYRNPFEETENDIVTALWQENFSHILYQEVDIFTLESFEFDLNSFKVTPEKSSARKSSSGEDSRRSSMREPAGRMEQGILAAAALEKNSRHQEDEPSLPDRPESISQVEQNRFLSEQGMNLLVLTAEEKKILKECVQEEENKNFTSDVLDVLLVILVTQNNRDNFSYTLEFLEFEFFETMERMEFNLVFKLLNNLSIIRKQFETLRPWCIPLIDRFFDVISEKERFLQLGWIRKDDFSWFQSPYIAQFWQVLGMLSPRFIFTLGHLLNRVPLENKEIRSEILKILEKKAAQEPKIIGALLSESDQRLNLELAPLLNNLPQKDASEIYLQLTRHHSAEVRKTGLDGYILSENSPDFDRLFHLLGDSSPLIRNRAVNYLLNAGEETASTLLMRFLSEDPSAEDSDQKIIIRHYYKALASCKSCDCIPFLENKLMESRLMNIFGNSNAIHKEGAALALKTIGTPDAMKILEKGAKSLKPDIRFACRKALEN